VLQRQHLRCDTPARLALPLTVINHLTGAPIASPMFSFLCGVRPVDVTLNCSWCSWGSWPSLSFECRYWLTQGPSRNKQTAGLHFKAAGWRATVSKRSVDRHQYLKRVLYVARSQEQKVKTFPCCVEAAAPDKASFCLGKKSQAYSTVRIPKPKNTCRGERIVQQNWHDFLQRNRTTVGCWTRVPQELALSPHLGGESLQ
jgi:hypothetical protein